MTLLISAQDIKRISLGLADKGMLVREEEFAAPPERYLERVARTLETWKVDPRTGLTAVAVVTGPGAFTSSRVSTVIANSIAFAAGIPVIPLENPDQRGLKDLAAALPTPDAVGAGTQAFAQPTYNRPPNITLQK